MWFISRIYSNLFVCKTDHNVKPLTIEGSDCRNQNKMKIRFKDGKFQLKINFKLRSLSNEYMTANRYMCFD